MPWVVYYSARGSNPVPLESGQQCHHRVPKYITFNTDAMAQAWTDRYVEQGGGGELSLEWRPFHSICRWCYEQEMELGGDDARDDDPS